MRLRSVVVCGRVESKREEALRIVYPPRFVDAWFNTFACLSFDQESQGKHASVIAVDVCELLTALITVTGRISQLGSESQGSAW